MYPRNPTRWRTRFGSWVNRRGVASIVRELAHRPHTAITRRTVYGWLEGHTPHPDRALALVRLAGGEITLDDIYGHRAELARLERTIRTKPRGEG